MTATSSAVLIEPAGQTASAPARGPQEIVELVDTRFAPDDEQRYPRRALIARAAGGAATLGVFPLVAAACGSSTPSTTSSSTTTTSTPTKSLKVGDAYICHQTYALCTNAACVPSADDPNVVVCDCVVEPGYSVGFKPCPQRAPHGTALYSNFSTALATSGVRAMTRGLQHGYLQDHGLVGRAQQCGRRTGRRRVEEARSAAAVPQGLPEVIDDSSPPL